MSKDNEEKVFYCKNCLSLNIKYVMPGISYCKECNCGQVLKTTFDNWDRIYQDKYGEKFLITKNDKR